LTHSTYPYQVLRSTCYDVVPVDTECAITHGEGLKSMQRRKHGHVCLLTSHISISVIKYRNISAFNAFSFTLFISLIDLWCRSQWPLACWDCGFESHRGNGCLSVV